MDDDNDLRLEAPPPPPEDGAVGASACDRSVSASSIELYTYTLLFRTRVGAVRLQGEVTYVRLSPSDAVSSRLSEVIKVSEWVSEWVA